MKKESKTLIIVRIVSKVREGARMSRLGVVRAPNGLLADTIGVWTLGKAKDEKGDPALVRLGKWKDFSRQGLEKLDKVEDWVPYKIKSPLVLLAECSE